MDTPYRQDSEGGGAIDSNDDSNRPAQRPSTSTAARPTSMRGNRSTVTAIVPLNLRLSGCRVCLGTCAGTEEPMRGDQWDYADGVPGNINEVELGA